MGTPPTFSDGTVAHAADLAFALDPPRCQVSWTASGGAQNVADGATALLSYDAETYVTDGMHSTSTNPSRILINTPGVYLFHCYVAGAAATYTVNNINPRLNSFGASGGGTSIRTHPNAQNPANRITFERQFNAGDHVEVFWTQTSGATRAVATGNNVTGVTARWVAYQ